jgi:hypothetical protein
MEHILTKQVAACSHQFLLASEYSEYRCYFFPSIKESSKLFMEFMERFVAQLVRFSWNSWHDPSAVCVSTTVLINRQPINMINLIYGTKKSMQLHGSNLGAAPFLVTNQAHIHFLRTDFQEDIRIKSRYTKPLFQNFLRCCLSSHLIIVSIFRLYHNTKKLSTYRQQGQ